MNDKEFDVFLREALRDEPPPSEGAECLSVDDLWDFLAKTLPPPQKACVEAHLAACSRCVHEMARLYRVLTQEDDAAETNVAVVPVPVRHSLWLVLVDFFRPPAVHWGVTAIAAALILVIVWHVRRPQPPNPQSNLWAATPAEKRFLAWAADAGKETLRSGGTPNETSLTTVKPHLTIVRSQTPELVAEASGVAGPFTFQVDEVKWEDGEWVEVKVDVAKTKGKPVDNPRLVLTKPLERGKVYAWRVSAGGQQSEWAYFMVAEHRGEDK